MKKLLLLLPLVVLLACSEEDTAPTEYVETVHWSEQEIVTDRSGKQYPFLDPNVLSYCGPGPGRKFCRFLYKYEGTIWADADNYYSDFSDIKFLNFSSGVHFMAFFDLNNDVSYCEGWKLNETTYNGIRRNIKIKKDEDDVFWFDIEYYGSGEEIEYTVNYKYEVINDLLHFSTTDGQAFVFSPSERNYSQDSVGTNEIVELEGCLFSFD